MNLLRKMFDFAVEPPTKKVKTRDTRQKKNKFETALGNFKEFLSDQNDKQVTTTNEMQKQWLDLQKRKLEMEQEERERERQHEMRMMEMFSAMIQRTSAQPPAPKQPRPQQPRPHSPVYTDLQNASQATHIIHILIITKYCIYICC